MTVRPLTLKDDSILRREVQDVTNFDSSLETLLQDLEDTLFAHDGLGIAAPQIGVDLKVALVDLEENGILQLINPVITSFSSETALDIEGCLSLPDEFGEVERSITIEVRSQDKTGRWVEITAHDDIARALQHEIDHLYGTLFTDKMTRRITLEELEELYGD